MEDAPTSNSATVLSTGKAAELLTSQLINREEWGTFSRPAAETSTWPLTSSPGQAAAKAGSTSAASSIVLLRTISAGADYAEKGREDLGDERRSGATESVEPLRKWLETGRLVGGDGGGPGARGAHERARRAQLLEFGRRGDADCA